MNNKVTFELSDLSYDELIETYREVLDFIKYLDEVSIKEEEEKEEKNGEEK
jgi:hypothetical protein